MRYREWQFMVNTQRFTLQTNKEGKTVKNFEMPEIEVEMFIAADYICDGVGGENETSDLV